MAYITIRQALQRFVDNPPVNPEITIDGFIHDLVPLVLYDIALNPDIRVRGGLARAARAQKMIFDRKDGTRKPGSRPVSLKKISVEFHDLTDGQTEGKV